LRRGAFAGPVDADRVVLRAGWRRFVSLSPVTSLFAQSPADPAVPPALQRVIRLIFLNLGLTVALTVLVLVFNDSLIGYQVAHTTLPPNTTEASLRISLRAASWSRLLSVGIISIVYVLLTKRLRQGRRRA